MQNQARMLIEFKKQNKWYDFLLKKLGTGCNRELKRQNTVFELTYGFSPASS